MRLIILPFSLWKSFLFINLLVWVLIALRDFRASVWWFVKSTERVQKLARDGSWTIDIIFESMPWVKYRRPRCFFLFMQCWLEFPTLNLALGHQAWPFSFDQSHPWQHLMCLSFKICERFGWCFCFLKSAFALELVLVARPCAANWTPQHC